MKNIKQSSLKERFAIKIAERYFGHSIYVYDQLDDIELYRFYKNVKQDAKDYTSLVHNPKNDKLLNYFSELAEFVLLNDSPWNVATIYAQAHEKYVADLESFS